MKSMKNRGAEILKVVANIIHGIVIALLGLYVFKVVICADSNLNWENFWWGIKDACNRAGLNEIFTFIGAIAFILFGIVGIYEYLYLNGIKFLVPPMFVEKKEETYIKQAEKMMQIYYDKDIQFIKKYEEERTDYMLQAIGIEEKQFNYINYQIIKERTKSAKDMQELKKKAQNVFLNKDFIIKQDEIPNSNRIYSKVDYYINLYTAFYDVKLCKDAASIMCDFLGFVLEQNLVEVDYLVVPEGGNFLLGLETGRLLHKPVISILNKGRIYQDTYWDGDYNKAKVNNVVVIHDVLVTGERIYSSIERLTKNTYDLVGVFCLMQYESDSFSLKEMEKHNIDEEKINCLLKVNESMLKGVYENE